MSSSPAVLKQQAAALELKKQPEKALALYQQLLAEYGGTDDVDVALRNRVGDLHLRVGQIDEAIKLFERSADEYALSGFLNNAIALCNKILRHRAGHVPTLRRLARFSAEKGMVVDAQRHYLSVAEALEKLGQHGEALKALSEFAELSPEDGHVRSVVVEQLLRAGRKLDALPHLTVLHALHVAAGRTDEAEGVAQVAREIDNTWMPESEQIKSGKRADLSLVLIDSDDDFGMLETSPMPGGESTDPAPVATLSGLELIGPTDEATNDLNGSQSLDGFEATSFGAALAEEGGAALTAEDEPSAESTFPSGHELRDFDSGGIDASTEAIADFATIGLDNLELIGPADFSDAPEPDPSVQSLEDFPPAFGSVETSAAPPAGTPSLPIIGGGEALFDMQELELLDVGTPLPVAEEPVAEVVEAVEFVREPVAVAPPAPVAPPRPKRPTPTYVSLAEILREEEPESERMTIGEPKQTGDEDADFQHILAEFRDGIEKTIPTDDAASHFDLGIAFREMGLLDDAIAEFQIAGRSQFKRVESIEALGGCFMDKGEPEVTVSLLTRALNEPVAMQQGDDILRGVLYLLGQACVAIGAREDGLRYYQRVYAVDIRFRDVAARIQTLQQPA